MVTAVSFASKVFARTSAYLAALRECSEPSIATRIFENFLCSILLLAADKI